MKKYKEQLRYAAARMNGARVKAEASLTDLRTQLGTLGRAVEAAHGRVVSALSATNYDEAAYTQARADYDSAVGRYNAMRDMVRDEEARQSQRLVGAGSGAQETTVQTARGHLFRAMLGAGGSVREVMSRYSALLGSFPEGSETLNGGESFLPETVSSTLVAEAFERGDVLSRITTTAIPGLKLPRVAYNLDDDDDVADGEVARELALKGDMVTFERHESRVFTEVSNSVLNGSVVALDGYIMGALEDGLRVKTLRRLFASEPRSNEKHMSLYSAENAIKVVTGTTLFSALLHALADLPDAARDKAEIIMRYSDYVDMIEQLSGSESLFGRKPNEALGVPIHFSSRAVTPVVGDLAQIHHNYEGLPTQDTGKEVTRGVRQFVIEADDDIRIRLTSYLRLAKVAGV